MSWPRVKLGDVATINPRPQRDVDESQQVTFVAMASASEDGHLLASEKRILSETKKGFTYFDRNDVLLAKITPCFENGKCLRPGQISTDIGFGSTEFHVIRPDAERLDGLYLFYLVWNEQFRFWGEKSMSGAAGQRRVGSDFLKGFEIPLPPLPEQKRIAAILDKADAIRRKRQQAIQLADDFLRAVFLDMFGDPATNPKGWEVKTLGELCAKITDGEHGTVKRLESGKLYLMARNIDRKGNLDLSDVSYIGEADHQRIYKRCGPEKGDVLLVCVGATIGKALIVPDVEEFSLARSVALLKPGKKIISEYLLSLINTEALQNQFVSSGNSSAQAGLYLGKIKEIMVPVPGVEEQLRFKKIVDFFKEKFSSKIGNGNLESDFVLGLSQKAFSGQL